MSRGIRINEWLLMYVLSVVVALGVSSVVVEATGGDWWPVLEALVEGSLLAPGRWGETLGVAVPLVLVALGTVISSKAGLVNIGQEGQLLMGAAFAVYFGFLLGGPGVINLVVVMMAGALGGAVWASVAGLLRFWRGVPEVLSTLLLVVVASQAVGYGLKQQWLLLEPGADRGNRNQVSQQLASGNRVPRLDFFGNQFPVTVFVAVVLALLVAFMLARTVWGMRLRMLGHNHMAAHRVGVSATSYGLAALGVGGAFAGLAGAAMFAGGGFSFGNYQLGPGFADNIGWTGLLVALVARERVLVVPAVAFVFAGLRTGAGFVNSTGVESRITEVVQALLVLALLLPPAVVFLRTRRQARSVALLKA
ncbi:MAG: ABC transporter permease [Acidimicrobiia bacterium]|nr:ABC transporter permease [Acidimicrobiia bacterium]MYC57256.1 ABC transporter permease [Acidimicrobiia bacterium]MYG94460.1 ABC transporter permease [Acidimicrobiia bacterium]MYI30954.1 ABC transporter permease [Acidimicrobiia bacterium]